MRKRCNCGSYAINIERFTGENCDVCHYKNRIIKLEKFIADDSFAITFQTMGQYRSAILKMLRT